MSPNIYRETRDRIAKIVGRPITQQEFGEALGLGGADAARSVRAWESPDARPPRGLAAIGLDYLRQGLGDDLATHMGGLVGADVYVHRCRWPRFVARVIPPSQEPAEADVSGPFGDFGHRLAVVRWTDRPMFGVEPQALVDEAAAWLGRYSQFRRSPSKGRPAVPSAPPPPPKQSADQGAQEEQPQPA